MMDLLRQAVDPAAVAGTDVAFYVGFGLFLLAFVVLAVVTLRWAVRRDRAGRAEWARRRQAGEAAGTTVSATNGRRPSASGDRPRWTRR